MATDTELSELRALAKEAGIKSWHVKSADTLQKELDALTSDNKPEADETPEKEAVVEPEQPATHEIPAPQARSNVRMQHPRTGEVLMVWDKDVTHYREKGWNLA